MDQAETKIQYGFENKILTYQSKDKDGITSIYMSHEDSCLSDSYKLI